MNYFRRDDKTSPIRVSVFNVVGNSFCVDATDGEAVFATLSKAVQQNQPVELSFQNVDMLTSAFLNTAIGQLYRDFSEKQIRDLLSVTEIANEDKVLLKRVIETAKLYYKDPQWLEDSIKKIMGEEE